MQSLFILKPDMVDNQDAISFFYEKLESLPIEILDEYSVKDWFELSKFLYATENQQQKLQMLTTIRGYYDFHNQDGVLLLVDVSESNLEDLVCLKKELRKRFVYNTDKFYLKFEDDLDLSQPLAAINISNLKVSYQIVPFFEEVEESGYKLCFFNKIHCPDPDVKEINRELEIIHNFGIIKKENKVKIRR